MTKIILISICITLIYCGCTIKSPIAIKEKSNTTSIDGVWKFNYTNLAINDSLNWPVTELILFSFDEDSLEILSFGGLGVDCEKDIVKCAYSINDSLLTLKKNGKPQAIPIIHFDNDSLIIGEYDSYEVFNKIPFYPNQRLDSSSLVKKGFEASGWKFDFLNESEVYLTTTLNEENAYNYSGHKWEFLEFSYVDLLCVKKCTKSPLIYADLGDSILIQKLRSPRYEVLTELEPEYSKIDLLGEWKTQSGDQKLNIEPEKVRLTKNESTAVCSYIFSSIGKLFRIENVTRYDDDINLQIENLQFFGAYERKWTLFYFDFETSQFVYFRKEWK